jgi:hypothetical protein
MVLASTDCKFISKGKVLFYTITKPASVVEVASNVNCTTTIVYLCTMGWNTKKCKLYYINQNSDTTQNTMNDTGLEETKNYNEQCSIKHSDI